MPHWLEVASGEGFQCINFKRIRLGRAALLDGRGFTEHSYIFEVPGAYADRFRRGGAPLSA